MVKKLSEDGFQRAKAYIFEHGRKVDQARFAYYFENGSADAVIEALAQYQNEDGGFGHGIEPDARTPASTAVASYTAFDILRAVDAPAHAPVVQNGILWFIQTYDHDRHRWEIVPPEVDQSPRAFWWEYAGTEEGFGGFAINPRACILGHLYHYRALVPSELLEGVSQALLDHLSRVDNELQMFDVVCLRGLVEANNVPDEVRNPVKQTLRRAAKVALALNPAQWGEMTFTPLTAAPTPDSVLHDLIADDVIDENLDYLIEHQQDDGTWLVPWSWEALDAEAWAQAHKDWKSIHAVENLHTLKAYGRL